MNQEHYITFPQECKPDFGSVLCAIDPGQKVTVYVNSKREPLINCRRCEEISINRYMYLTGCRVSGMMVQGDQLVLGIMVGGGPR